MCWKPPWRSSLQAGSRLTRHVPVDRLRLTAQTESETVCASRGQLDQERARGRLELLAAGRGHGRRRARTAPSGPVEDGVRYRDLVT